MNIHQANLLQKTKAICDAARKQGCAYISTNGKIDLMMIDLSDFDTLNDAVHSYDEWMAMRTLRALWDKTEGRPISREDIEREISSHRSEQAQG